jgi:mono/diheme cytochrome c family protein
MSTQGGFVQRKSRRIGATLVVLAVLVGGGASSYAASAHHGQAQTIVKVSAALKGTGVSGSFSGTLNAKPASGLLAWKFTLSPSTTVSAAELHTGATGAGALLGKLCGPCSVSHGTKTLTKSAATAVAGGKAAIVLRTATHGKVLGHVKAASGSPSAGGGLVITPTPALVAQGKALTAKFSCGGCHTIDGTKSAGPTWKGLAGSKVHLTGGKTIVATDSYLVSVITDPSTLQVVGFDPALMQSYIPTGTVSDAQAKALVAYIKTLK